MPQKIRSIISITLYLFANTSFALNPIEPLELFHSLGLTSQEGNCRISARKLARKFREGTSVNELAPDYACLALQQNIRRDSMESCRPSLSSVTSALQALEPLEFKIIQGTNAYVGFVHKPYHYAIQKTADGMTEIILRIAFSEGTAQQIESMTLGVAFAQETWNIYRPMELRNKVRFKFEVVSHVDGPHFTLPIYEGDGRIPYDRAWYTRWTRNNTLAHEIGHMLGLDDEYKQIRDTLGFGRRHIHRQGDVVESHAVNRSHCYPHSLLCNSNRGRPLSYHYYLILRRLLCEDQRTPYPTGI